MIWMDVEKYNFHTFYCLFLMILTSHGGQIRSVFLNIAYNYCRFSHLPYLKSLKSLKCLKSLKKRPPLAGPGAPT